MSSSTAAPDSPWRRVLLADLGALSVRGADAVRFLQGQLSNDVERLAATRSLMAGLHNPQGRAIALMRLVQLAPGEILALLPRELAAPAAARLSKFILRAKVSISDASASWAVHGLIAPAGAPVPALLPQDMNGQATLEDGSLAVRVTDEARRWLLITKAGQPLPAALPQAVDAGRELWLRLDIQAGLPQICAATSEAFVAQMLNLDLIDAVSFEKGCFTGQEVIARAHWRGRVKRRMQRFVSRGAVQLAPADTRTLTDGRPLTVVEAVAREDGRSEFLGVTALNPGESAEAAGTAPPADAVPAGQPLDAEPLPLPYSLP